MNLSILALIFVGIISIYAIAFTMIIRLLGRKFKDKSNMYFLYASIILVIHPLQPDNRHPLPAGQQNRVILRPVCGNL